MDRNALDWLFSTAPQSLAALVGLIFAGVSFIVTAIDKQVELDDSREDICKAMKLQIHMHMKWLFCLSGVSIILDLIFLLLNPIEDGLRFSFDGTFSPYLLIAGLTLLLNFGTLIYSLWFIITVASPDYFSNTVKRLSAEEHVGTIEVKEFLMAFIGMEKALRNLKLFRVPQGEKPLTVTEMLKVLKYRKFMDARDVDDMFKLTRLRNLIMHGADIEHVEQQMYDKAKRYTNDLMKLKGEL